MSEFDWSPFEGDRWAPDTIGDEIKGKVLKIETVSIGGDQVPCVTLEVEGGARKEIRCGTDLKRKLAKDKPQVGDLLKARLVDLQFTGQPQPMKVFAVRVQRAGAAPTPEPTPEPAPSSSLESYDNMGEEEPF